jgi:hypothetical protein
MSIATFTIVHVIISLVAIASGLVVVVGLLRSDSRPAWTTLFLVTTILTSVTGFLFPISVLTPALVTGVLSLVLLAATMLALSEFRLMRAWRLVYVITATAALYLNCFVLVVQSFLKIPFLHALAPTQQETPFLVAQTVVLVLFLLFGFLAARRFHPAVMARA